MILPTPDPALLASDPLIQAAMACLEKVRNWSQVNFEIDPVRTKTINTSYLVAPFEQSLALSTHDVLGQGEDGREANLALNNRSRQNDFNPMPDSTAIELKNLERDRSFSMCSTCPRLSRLDIRSSWKRAVLEHPSLGHIVSGLNGSVFAKTVLGYNGPT